jgi:hypothetical protein
MKIDNSGFFVVDCGGSTEICITLKEAVGLLRASDSDDAEIQRFHRESGKWMVSLVSWKEISKLLLAGGDSE